MDNGLEDGMDYGLVVSSPGSPIMLNSDSSYSATICHYARHW